MPMSLLFAFYFKELCMDIQFILTIGIKQLNILSFAQLWPYGTALNALSTWEWVCVRACTYMCFLSEMATHIITTADMSGFSKCLGSNNFSANVQTLTSRAHLCRVCP
jgi:hypothetical protein